eukprot:6963263-Prymnesium_polylepis.1
MEHATTFRLNGEPLVVGARASVQIFCESTLATQPWWCRQARWERHECRGVAKIDAQDASRNVRVEGGGFLELKRIWL